MLRAATRAALGLGRQQDRVPSAAERHDKVDAGQEKILSHRQFRFMVSEQLDFREDDVVDATVPTRNWFRNVSTALR
jgi:hypothetical protein